MWCPVRNRVRLFVLIAGFAFVSSLRGQESCSEEVKLLLAPTQVQAAIPVLQARGERHRRVDFYDTPGLDLLSNGVILRLREGEAIDLTAKLRPPRARGLPIPPVDMKTTNARWT